MDNATMTRKRPIGVSIIAVLVTLGGIITLIAAIYWFFGLGLFGFHLPGSVRGYALWYGTVAALIGLLQLYFAWGLWTLKRWAFWATVILEILNIAGILTSWMQRYSSFGFFLFSLVIPVIILVYFLADHKVRQAFGM
jgi:hypothetical protein